MSRVGNKPIDIPAGVTVSVKGSTATVKGAKGELSLNLPSGITAVSETGRLTVSRAEDTRPARSSHGLIRSLLAGMIEGVVKGYSRDLEIQGVGFKGELKGKVLSLSLGFSSPILFPVPDGVAVAVEGGTKLKVSGTDKQKVGEVAARIRAFYPAEPYKGKGVRYVGEHVRRKEGKTVA
jgi:large subunit ribosomal protein L6